MPAIVEQPELRDPLPSERIVRTGGLYYILPNAWSAGQVLTPELAAFLNAAWHSAFINRFKEARKALEEDPATTYKTIDDALQAAFDEFSVTPRATKPLEIVDDDEDAKEAFKALVSFARPEFNRAMKEVKGLPRKKYEELLREYVRDNAAVLQEAMDASNASIERAVKNLAASLPSGED